MAQFWIPSKENPADDPSRHVDLREPEEVRPDLRWLLKAEATSKRETGTKPCAMKSLCRECFAGCGGLTEALKRSRVEVAEPMEAYPKKGMYVATHDLMVPHVLKKLRREIDDGLYGYVHFGIPCSSWSSLRLMSGGSRRKAFEGGDGKDEK